MKSNVTVTPKACATCAGFEKDLGLGVSKGRCKRHAPRPYVVPHGRSDFDTTLEAYWPVVLENGSCGEWTAKP
jgi:hypothetical protein